MSLPLIASLDERLNAADRTLGWSQPTRRLGFVIPPGLVVVAGASSIGTSSLALKITAELVSWSAACEALLLSVADGPQEIARRLSSYMPVLDRSPQATTQIWIDDGLALATDTIASRARQWAAAHKATRKLIVIDDLQHLAAVEQKPVAGARVATSLRRLASELEVTIMLCAEVPARRRRASWVPMRSDLLVYGPILEHCDATILIYRDAYYHGKTATPSDAELWLWPPQNGRSAVTLNWDTPSGTFGTPIGA
ncbi:MAG: DnaB-like helicase C-terminal domain-containing protein [Solirubrobacteraceae bacterium]